MKKTAILGFGNPVRSDDGIGIYVIDRLREKLPATDQISVLDMGTSAFEVLFQLRGNERIVIVDAVINSNEPVGTVFKLPADQIKARIQNDPLVFLHSLKWDQGLSYAKKILGADYPDDIQVFLIAVDDTKLEIRLSEEAKKGGNKVVEAIMDSLSELSV